jgi:very-short-patch-repair endonuclease
VSDAPRTLADVTESKRIALFAVAESQLGLISLQQVLEAGLSTGFLRQRLASGEWQKIHRGWFKIGSAPMTRAQRALATQLIAGEGAALSHFTAARHHKLDVPKTHFIDVTVPHARHAVQFDGARIFRSRDFGDADTLTVGAFRFTTPERTIMDVAPLLSRSRRWTRALLYSAHREDNETLSRLELILKEQGRGRPETAVLRALIERHTGKDQLPMRLAESFFLDLCELSDIAPDTQYCLHERHHADFAFCDHGLVIEVDSEKFHNNWAARTNDLARDRAVLRSGWVTARFTWAEIRDDRDRVLEEVRQLLAIYSPRAAIPPS